MRDDGCAAAELRRLDAAIALLHWQRERTAAGSPPLGPAPGASPPPTPPRSPAAVWCRAALPFGSEVQVCGPRSEHCGAVGRVLWSTPSSACVAFAPGAPGELLRREDVRPTYAQRPLALNQHP
eukprot:TRINITY_DN60951_c0_g1_i1.p4 TRINITY_DN60951_c0_g1~~TRINITY_DN60951_c0_g1_i1.p4  ORF type:complete len:124 (+),score=19.34 TRINITY_DN60951_c0_g1_i1:81-452(+)